MVWEGWHREVSPYPDLISGEPGIGKSRLTAELSERIASEPHTRLRYFCSPHHQDSALYPFITQLERTIGFAREETVEEKRKKFRETIASGARGDFEIELLAELLSLPNSAADLNLSPQRKREMLLEALFHQLEAVARRQQASSPVVGVGVTAGRTVGASEYGRHPYHQADGRPDSQPRP